MNPKRTTPKHIIIKMSKVKDKERILKVAKEKQLLMYKGAPIILSPNFSTGIFQAKKGINETFKLMKHKDL